MTTLAGSTRDPREKQDVPQQHPSQELLAAIDMMEDRLTEWSVFLATEGGGKAKNLADKFIEQLLALLTMPSEELAKHLGVLDHRLVEARRDEYRGELKVWKMIRFQPKELERRLKDLEDGGVGKAKRKT